MPTNSGERTARELREAVRRGVALLDEKMPGIWRRVLRTKDFNFVDPCKCVVGFVGACQIGGTEDPWHKGKRALGLNSLPDRWNVDCHPVTGEKLTVYYGFDETSFRERRHLASYWRKAIRGEKV